MEDFSGLALPPLFGGHILEAELEPGGVELGPGEVRILIVLQFLHFCLKFLCGHCFLFIFSSAFGQYHFKRNVFLFVKQLDT